MKRNAFISMLRGVNVGGRKKMSMNELRSLYEALELERVVTHVQSGNVVFESAERNPSTLAGRIEDRIERAFGYRVPVFIRRTGEFERMLDGNPFLLKGQPDPSHLHVTFLYGLPSTSKVRALRPAVADGEGFSVQGREIYLHCPNGYGRTRLTNVYFEKNLDMPATTRNWNTANALYRIATQE
jgi:uncharacterized protein (DUF1697 family)